MILKFPRPPSVNSMFATDFKTRRRFKTKVYADWQKEADAWLMPPLGPSHVETIDGPYTVDIRIPAKTRGDVDNYIKPIVDLLHTRGVTPDDRVMRRVSAEKCPALENDCWVEIKAVPPVT